jgi:hypothetical protein
LISQTAVAAADHHHHHRVLLEFDICVWDDSTLCDVKKTKKKRTGEFSGLIDS